MTKSMTGFGEARVVGHGSTCVVEIRAVNNRQFKLQARLPETHAALESFVENSVREKIHRGTIQLWVRLARQSVSGGERINSALLNAYLEQLRPLTPIDGPLVGAILQLPGVVSEMSDAIDVEKEWAFIGPVVCKALERLDEMRKVEGASMAAELSLLLGRMEAMLGRVADKVPDAVRAYRDRMLDRVRALLRDTDASVGESDLLRELAIFADRTDINEELVRLRSHILLFRQTLVGTENCGRKLEFLAQEMGREANTMSSKTNDPTLSGWVVDIKTDVERIREIIQNIE